MIARAGQESKFASFRSGALSSAHAHQPREALSVMQVPPPQLDEGEADATAREETPPCAVDDWLVAALLRSSHHSAAVLKVPSPELNIECG